MEINKLGQELWDAVQTPQGHAFISDSCLFMTNDEVIERAKNALVCEQEVVRQLRAFLRHHKSSRQ